MGISQDALRKRQKEILYELNNCKHEWKGESMATMEDNEAMFSFYCENCGLNITIVDINEDQ